MLFNITNLKNKFAIMQAHFSLYFILLFAFFMLFIKAGIKLFCYFYVGYYNVEYISILLLSFILCICYALTYFFTSFREKIIDSILKIFLHRYFIAFTQFTVKIVTFFVNKNSWLSLVIIIFYFPFMMLYYLDVVYFQYNINMSNTIRFYFIFYTIRTLLFLPSYILALISNHPRSDELFQDFFKRNPNYEKELLSVLNKDITEI